MALGKPLTILNQNEIKGGEKELPHRILQANQSRSAFGAATSGWNYPIGCNLAERSSPVLSHFPNGIINLEKE
ncbi:MAG: hypothetical protein IPF94_18495 [Betaproteobacteria bacterium]|nr:hypothetical protein [Betaproteobacteria bacterium]